MTKSCDFIFKEIILCYRFCIMFLVEIQAAILFSISFHFKTSRHFIFNSPKPDVRYQLSIDSLSVWL